MNECEKIINILAECERPYLVVVDDGQNFNGKFKGSGADIISMLSTLMQEILNCADDNRIMKISCMKLILAELKLLIFKNFTEDEVGKIFKGEEKC